MPAPAPITGRNAVKLVQLTDCHLVADRNATYKGVNPRLTLQRVCGHVLEKHADAAALLLTGDLSQDGSAESYRILNESMARIGLPAYAIPGNHDDWAVLCGTAAAPVIIERRLQFGDWEILLARSDVAGRVEGALADAELEWLEECLTRPAAPAQLLAVHHPPLPLGSAWMDRIGLLNAERLFALTGPDSRLKVIVHGHAHQAGCTRRGEIVCYGTPSTWRQFVADSPTHRMDILPPAVRVIWLNYNARCTSWVEFV